MSHRIMLRTMRKTRRTTAEIPLWCEKYNMRPYVPDQYEPKLRSTEAHDWVLYLVDADLDADPMAVFRQEHDAKTALRMLNRADADRHRYRQHLHNELHRMREGYYKIHDAGGKKDPNAEVQDYLKLVEKIDSHIFNEIAMLDKLRDIFSAELRSIKSELRLVNTPLNSSVASLNSSRVDDWLQEKRNEPRKRGAGR